MQLSDGVVLADRYVLQRELGRGGMATVWLANDQRRDRLVAVKVMNEELASAVAVDRFVREVRITAGLEHPNVLPVFDSGALQTASGTRLPWCAMAYVAGNTLRQRLDAEPQMAVNEALRITKDVASALDFAHRRGIVHRDLKPENILITADRAYVLDFGIAKALEAQSDRLTSTGVTVGTPTYMSPEQSLGSTVDARSDQYSLAAVLYEMLAGEPPFGGPNAQAIIARRLAESARPLRHVRSTVSEVVQTAVLRALERAPADRYPDIQSFVAALNDSRAVPAWNRRKSRWLAASLVGLLVVAAAALWLPGGTAGRDTRSRDAQIAMLYDRGLREYDRRTSDGIVEAVAAFNAVLARDSSHAGAWSGLAKAYVRAEERGFSVPGVPSDALIRLAVRATDRALAVDSSDADAWLTHGIVQLRLNPSDAQTPRRAIDRAIHLDSSLAEAWHFRARTLAEAGDMERALAAWRTSVRVGPRYAQGLAFLALAHYWRRDFDSAAVWADSAVAVQPVASLPHLTVGEIAVERGEFTKALAAFDAARRLGSDTEIVNALAHSAFAHARAGDRRAARLLLQRADSLARHIVPPPVHIAVYLAQAYTALGTHALALSWIDRVSPRGDLHFQLHLRCDPPFDPLRRNPAFRTLIIGLAGTHSPRCQAAPSG